MSTADFKLVRPVTITDALLTSTTAPETVAATYAGGTTYGAGDLAGAASTYGSPQTVYKSLQAANTGHAQASSPTWWQPMGSVYPAYASGSSCGVGGIVSSISADIHLLYESLVAANTGNALTDATKWLFLGSTNARAMFDTTYGSQTEEPESIVAVITPTTLINTVFLGNLDAASVTVTQAGSGYSSTVNLNSHPVINWYDWFYEELIHSEQDLVFEGIPPYIGNVLTITISNVGSTAKCGILIVGKSAIIGQTQWEVLGSIVSYSGTSADAYGNTTFVPRAKVNRLNLDVRIAAGFESEAHRLLKLYTDVPTLFIGSTEYSMTLLYGALGSWQVPISNVGKTAPIELIGLT